MLGRYAQYRRIAPCVGDTIANDGCIGGSCASRNTVADTNEITTRRIGRKRKIAQGSIAAARCVCRLCIITDRCIVVAACVGHESGNTYCSIITTYRICGERLKAKSRVVKTRSIGRQSAVAKRSLFQAVEAINIPRRQPIYLQHQRMVVRVAQKINLGIGTTITSSAPCGLGFYGSN